MKNSDNSDYRIFKIVNNLMIILLEYQTILLPTKLHKEKKLGETKFDVARIQNEKSNTCAIQTTSKKRKFDE